MNEKPLTVALVRDKPEQLPVPANGSVDSMIVYAMSRNASIAELRELYALQREFKADQAREAYDLAMAAFKKNPPTIFKDTFVSYPNSKGGKTEYSHASLGGVCEAVIAGLAQHDLTHRWDTVQHDGGMIEVQCIIKHALGHSEKTSLKASRDDSGGKNNIQSVASAISYLQRYTLLAACGLASRDMDDDDGREADGKPTSTLMTDEHSDTIDSLCKSISSTVLNSVLKSYKVQKLEQIPDIEYEGIVRRLNITKEKKQ